MAIPDDVTFDLQRLAPAVRDAVLHLLTALCTVPSPQPELTPASDTLQAAEAIVEAVQHEAQARYPRCPTELRVLEALASVAPLALTPKQVAGLVGLPVAGVQTILHAFATLGTIHRPGKSYYQYVPPLGEGDAHVEPCRRRRDQATGGPAVGPRPGP